MGRKAAIASIFVVAAVLAGFALYRRNTPTMRCPEGHELDEQRAARLWSRLSQVPEGARLLERLAGDRLVVCFGPAEPPGTISGTLLLLDARLDDDAAAARAAHLVSHRAEQDQLDPEAATDCDAFGRQALAAEERAHRLEIRVAAELAARSGVPAPVAPDPSSAARSVVDAYLDRCRRARDAAR